MKPNPVGWFEIYVQDMPRAIAFYEAMLATKLEKLPTSDPETWPDMEMWTFPMSDCSEPTYGAAGTLVKMGSCPSVAGGTLVYFSCEDCAVEASRAAANGGSIFKEKSPSANTVLLHWCLTPKAT